MLRIAGLVLVLFSLASCKLAVLVVEGGSVQSASGTRNCLEQEVCVFLVDDTNFTETFTAVPNEGWSFVRWNSGAFFLCGDSNDPVCVVSNTGLAGNPDAESIVQGNTTFYLMPVFEGSYSSNDGEPIVDTIVAGGREWAQVDLFTDLSWDEIKAVCPAGLCNGKLNGFDMTGWKWASVEDMNALFNDYIGDNVLGPGPSQYLQGNSAWEPAFFADGWRPTNFISSTRDTSGLTRDMLDDTRAAVAFIANDDEVLDGAITSSPLSPIQALPTVGAWFYRSP